MPGDKSLYKQLKYQSLEYQREQYDEKNMVLEQFGEWIDAWSMYEDIFPDMEMLMPIIIIDEEEQKHVLKMTIEEAIDTCKGRNDVLMGGTSYFNEYVSKATANTLYAFIIDMDNVYSGTLLRALQHDWKTENGKPIPMPTYIVNSGTGLHLYFVLDRPLPCYKSQLANIDQLYRRLAVMETTKRVYLRQSVQWFGQDFRMAGGNGKNGWENTVFRVGKKWDVDQLGKAVGLENVHFLHEGEVKSKKVDKKKKDHKRKSKPRTGYYLDKAVYTTSVERCKNETHEGNRYMSMCALSVLAWKCKVPIEQLEEDLISLLPLYNNGAVRKVKNKEIYSAIKMYNERAINTPKVRSEDWLGWKFKGSDRNFRKQHDHLRTEYFTGEDGRKKVNPCAQNRELALQFLRENGKIEGRPKKKTIVEEWRKAHPDGKKADCIRETGLSKPTVYKWWDGGRDAQESEEKRRKPKIRPMTAKEKEDYDRMAEGAEQLRMEMPGLEPEGDAGEYVEVVAAARDDVALPADVLGVPPVVAQ